VVRAHRILILLSFGLVFPTNAHDATRGATFISSGPPLPAGLVLASNSARGRVFGGSGVANVSA
jgi:hypothetical protein